MRNKLIGLAAAVTIAFAASPFIANAAPPVKNIVLVHGAFVDGSSWIRIIPILQAKGFHVTAVQNPLTSFADDVAATKRVLAQQDGPTILVGHSWGGVVITEAGGDAKVAGLVYVAAFGPDKGESVTELGKGKPTSPALAHLIVDKDGFATVPAEDVVAHFAQDLPAAEGRVAAAVQGPVHVSVFDAKPSVAAWRTKPSWYIVSKNDHAIAPDAERFFAKRMNAKTTELNSSHVSMLSQPDKVAAVIVDAATHAANASGN